MAREAARPSTARISGDAREGGTPYRADIDGIRAIAVTLVVLGHLGVPGFGGGFIGVDVFFVISGYLIACILARAIDDGTFSIARFYERRLRRIVPALVVLLVATSIMAYETFLPADLERYGRALLAAMLSYSNVFFYATRTGYFGPTFTSVLIHTWSLGVEEQFYLVIPLVMAWIGKRKTLLRRTIVAAAVLSFAACAFVTFRDGDLAYLMPQYRAWELLAGSMLAVGIVPQVRSRALRETLALASVASLAACTPTYADVPFPGFAALVPCAATLALLAVGAHGGRTSIGSLLSWRPLAGLGRISYSLYLWHWPIVILVRLGAVDGVRAGTPLGDVVVIAASVACGYLSWRFVEQPIRSGRRPLRTKASVFRASAAAAAAVCAIALVFVARSGLPERFTPRELDIASFGDRPATMRSGTCFIETAFADFDRSGCLDVSATRKNVLVFGDSHAAALWTGLHATLPDANVMQATARLCAPTLGAYDPSDCGRLRRLVFEDVLPHHRLDAVVLSERWKSIGDLDALEPAIAWLGRRHVRVIVAGPAPEYTVPLPYLLALGMKFHDDALAGRNQITELRNLDRQMQQQLAGRRGVTYASIWRVVCPGPTCEVSAESVPMLRDADHLTDAGSTFVARALLRAGDLKL